MYGKTSKHPHHRSGSWLCPAITLITVVLLSGCAEQQVVDPPEPLAVPNLDKPTAMALSEEVLAQMHFRIEKADPDAGIVRTAPLTGSQFFEFWRKDSVGKFNNAESNLQNIRRIAEITVSDTDGRVHIACRTAVQRLTIAEHPTTSSARAYRMHSKSTSSLQKLRLSDTQIESMSWVDLGPDNELAAAILERIQSRIAQQQGGSAG